MPYPAGWSGEDAEKTNSITIPLARKFLVQAKYTVITQQASTEARKCDTFGKTSLKA